MFGFWVALLSASLRHSQMKDDGHRRASHDPPVSAYIPSSVAKYRAPSHPHLNRALQRRTEKRGKPRKPFFCVEKPCVYGLYLPPEKQQVLMKNEQRG